MSPNMIRALEKLGLWPPPEGSISRFLHIPFPLGPYQLLRPHGRYHEVFR